MRITRETAQIFKAFFAANPGYPTEETVATWRAEHPEFRFHLSTARGMWTQLVKIGALTASEEDKKAAFERTTRKRPKGTYLGSLLRHKAERHRSIHHGMTSHLR